MGQASRLPGGRVADRNGGGVQNPWEYAVNAARYM
jgi:hypothetical protein